MCSGNCAFGCCKDKKPVTVSVSTAESATVNKFVAEEPLADWEKELLLPDKDAVVHMYPADGMTACDTKLDDGRIHLITGNLAGVSCSDCRINTLTYYNEQLQAEVDKQKEKVRVAEQATSMVRRDLRAANQRVNNREQVIRHLRQEVDYLSGRSGPARLYPYDRRF